MLATATVTSSGIGLAFIVLCLCVAVLVLGTTGQITEVTTPPIPLPDISMTDWSTLIAYHMSIIGELQAQGVELDLTNHHAVQQHKLEDVELVHSMMLEKAAKDRTWWNRPPCKDGRHRYTLQLPDGRWAVWVLEQAGPGVMREVTAFITDSHSYVKAVRDNCGLNNWLGHSYS